MWWQTEFLDGITRAFRALSLFAAILLAFGTFFFAVNWADDLRSNFRLRRRIAQIVAPLRQAIADRFHSVPNIFWDTIETVAAVLFVVVMCLVVFFGPAALLLAKGFSFFGLLGIVTMGAVAGVVASIVCVVVYLLKKKGKIETNMREWAGGTLVLAILCAWVTTAWMAFVTAW